ncbi:hypothetical protein CHS0354_027644 [Potamilus streckersoni]|uniref:TFIIS N-terminal domain-containing protein n=1 Tax=Potamilus streckersoni TaxID=2493646 RepID=A0AAE0T0R1_9BIVA|nr:hypothetical protein CHS0354_027644 [Potamilus streckersoni]
MKMANADEVFKIGKKLEKMISSNTADHSSTIDLLKTLQEMPMNLDVLQKTRIGMTVNNVRKASTKEENITLAKSLIKSWKKLLPADGPTSNSSSKGGSKKESKNSEKNGRDVDTSEGENSNSNSQPEKPAAATNSVSDVGDPVRMKCRELIINALKPNGGDFETKYTPEEATRHMRR